MKHFFQCYTAADTAAAQAYAMQVRAGLSHHEAKQVAAQIFKSTFNRLLGY